MDGISPSYRREVFGTEKERGVGAIVESIANLGMRSLLQSCGERAFRFAFGVTGNIEDAKDLVQEAFRRLLVRFERIDLARSAEDWFFAILRNLCIDDVRRFERRSVISLDAPLDSEYGDGPLVSDRLAGDEEEPLVLLEREERVDWLRAAMKGLDPDFREALELSAMEGMTYDEIAKIVGCPIGTVRSRISRARIKVRRWVEQKMEAR